MSALMHATVSAWNREEDGSYVAEINGVHLHVKWKPEAPGQRRGFFWESSGPGDAKRTSDHLHEEIEVAMAEAEASAGKPMKGHESQTVD
jgi:hypothetical protein